MSAEDKERFQLSNIYLIRNKLFGAGDNKVRYHCHITRKYRGSAHWSCNINLRLTKKVPVIFHIIRGDDSHLIMQEIGKFDLKVNVITNVIPMKFMNFSLDALVKNLSDNDFKYLSEEFSGDLLKLVKQKGVYPYEYMNRFEKFFADKCE